MAKIYRDSAAWQSQTIEQQIEAMRRHYCTGPCGQSQDVLTTRSNTAYTLRAIKGLLANRAPGLMTEESIEVIGALEEKLDKLDSHDAEEVRFAQDIFRLTAINKKLRERVAELEQAGRVPNPITTARPE